MLKRIKEFVRKYDPRSYRAREQTILTILSDCTARCERINTDPPHWAGPSWKSDQVARAMESAVYKIKGVIEGKPLY